MRSSTKSLLVAVGVTTVLAGLAYAAPIGGGTAADVETFFSKTASFVIKIIGAGVFVIGLAFAGIKMSAGDQDGMRKAVGVLIGGAITFLAPTIANILKGMAGG